jgi:hypothetical protein
MAGESKAPGGVRPTRHALSRRHRSELDRKLLDSRVLRQGRRTSTAAFITPGSTKSPGAIVDTGAISRRRAKREGQDGPSQPPCAPETHGTGPTEPRTPARAA